MPGLKLRIDALAVESFAAPAAADAPKGTVRGQEIDLTIFYPRQCDSGGPCITYPTGCP